MAKDSAKLNVPRERFRKHPPRGPYEWAGLDLFEDRSRPGG